jgi:glycosyltransferase involved in cell wall biosynthesis
MLLLEAMVLGKPVVSVQPGLIREDTFIASRLGFAHALTDPAQGEKELIRLLTNPALRQTEAARHQAFFGKIPEDPVGRILKWIRAAATKHVEA